ncbi:hypothetical protein B0W48_10000 [Pseudoalteromonas aliena]|uniref:Amidohydrolase-related domain-containing protein n=1 Tax=Pseudoalteromonas aliena TaxID=247523 RepID=A0A1Q2GY79_9GAMM|nr:amidohydrolase family protein [Pseudoalteromonas aliena]AQQ00092.1 hypothetical protein B0W48_10000 [Pseudoalteromonas aliena]
MSTKIIDPHVHFFNLSEGQYSWLQGASPPAWPNLDKIKQPVSEEDLIQSTDFKLAGLVHIEAGFDNNAPINELHWLTTHLKKIPFKAISFAQIDQETNYFSAALKNIQHTHLAGIRDITEGNDATRLLNKNCFDNLEYLSHLKLHFEAQFELENIPVTEKIAHYAKQLPQLQIVINHAGLPNNTALWQQAIKQLAKHCNIFIKFSGFELLALNNHQQIECFNTILKQFGEQRIMFASNFPVCQINTSYNNLWHSYSDLCHSEGTWHQLSYKNAKHLYQV